MHISKDEIEYARLTTELKNILDYQSGMESARREGLARGQAKGLAKGKLEIARKMKKMGDTPEKICTITGLSLETIKQIN